MTAARVIDGNNEDANPEEGEGNDVAGGINDEEGRGGRKEPRNCGEGVVILGKGTWYLICESTSLDGGLKALPRAGAGTAITG